MFILENTLAQGCELGDVKRFIPATFQMLCVSFFKESEVTF